jgi:hypothetical protein
LHRVDAAISAVWMRDDPLEVVVHPFLVESSGDDLGVLVS